MFPLVSFKACSTFSMNSRIPDSLLVYSLLLKLSRVIFFRLQSKTVINSYGHITVIIIIITTREKGLTNVIIVYYFLMVFGV